MTYFAVITSVPDDLSGNLYTSSMLVVPSDFGSHLMGSGYYVSPPPKCAKEYFSKAFNKKEAVDKTKPHIVCVLIPAFKLGEIMVMGSDDRTIPDGRKPSKWSVEYEDFDKLEDAIKRSVEVFGGDEEDV